MIHKIKTTAAAVLRQMKKKKQLGSGRVLTQQGSTTQQGALMFPEFRVPSPEL